MGLLADFGIKQVKQKVKEILIEPQEIIGSEGFSNALDLCGNDGQAAVIEAAGVETFIEAASSGLGDGDVFSVLDGIGNHSAVADILDEAGGGMQDAIDDWLDKGDLGKKDNDKGGGFQV